MPAARTTYTEPELADLLGVTRSAVQQWREAGCPFAREKRGGRTVYTYELAAVSDWRLEQARATRRDEDIDEAKERARKMKADADLAELKLAERRRELVEVAAVLKSDERLFGVIRARVRAMRGKWAPRVLGLGTMGEATGVLDALADDVLAALVDGASEVEQDEPEREVA